MYEEFEGGMIVISKLPNAYLTEAQGRRQGSAMGSEAYTVQYKYVFYCMYYCISTYVQYK